MKYLVEGICFVPTEARITVEAADEVRAVELAMAEWKRRKTNLIDQNGGDYGAAFDWHPFAQPAQPSSRPD